MREQAENRILSEQVRQLYALAPMGIIATLLNAAVVFVVLREVAPRDQLLPWLGAMLCLSALRTALLAWYRRAASESREDGLTWSRRFTFSLVLIGLGWGSLGGIAYALPQAYQVFIAFVLGGMTAGATSTTSKVRGCFPAFSIPALLPLAIQFLLRDEPFHRAMGFMILLFLALLWRITRHNYQVNLSTLLLRQEKEQVIVSLSHSMERVEGLNIQLKEEILAKQQVEAELREYQLHLEGMVKERTRELTEAVEQLSQEIEDRKQAEAALRENRERLDLAQEAGRVGVYDWDMIQNRVIWTERLEELFGLEPRQFEGSYEAWARRIDGEDLARVEEQLRRLMEQRATRVDLEYRVIHPGGGKRWMKATGRISFAQDGTPVRVIGTVLDINDLKQAQESLMAAKEAAEAGNRAKSEFLANMSHEMRTPLAGALGMIRYVLGMEIGAEERQLLEMAQRSAESLLRLIGDVLDFARVEAGVMSLERHAFSVPELVRSAVEVLSLTARDKGLDLAWRVDDSIGEIEGDQGRVRQVLVNLIGNAVKFTEEGCVGVSVTRYCDLEAAGANYILFRVSDSGVGIPPEQLETIFDKFTQVDASLTRRYGGTGLGLALSRAIAQRLGGRLWAESHIGTGSTFYFAVPADRPALEFFGHQKSA